MPKAKAKTAPARRAAHKAVPVPAAVAATEAAWGGAFLFLLAALVLAGYNLSLTVKQSGQLSGLESSWQELQANYDAVLTSNREPEPPAQAMPSVLWSVVRFREGERDDMNLKLVGPLVAHSMESGPALEALLIERKNSGSRDVLVREFRKDGTEVSYLWPSTHSDAGGSWVAGK